NAKSALRGKPASGAGAAASAGAAADAPASPSAAVAATEPRPASSSRRFRATSPPRPLRAFREVPVAETAEGTAVDRNVFGHLERRRRRDREQPPQLIALPARLHRRGLEGDGDRAAPARDADQLDAARTPFDERQRVGIGSEADRQLPPVRRPARLAVDRARDELGRACAREQRRSAAAPGAEGRILGADVLERPATDEIVDALIDVRLERL